MSPEPGRNDPCPCGSGRKYKHCCLKANDASDFLWRQVRGAEGRFVPELFKLALKEFGGPFIAAAIDEFFLWEGVPEDFEQTEDFVSFFLPWLFTSSLTTRMIPIASRMRRPSRSPRCTCGATATASPRSSARF